MMAKLLQRLFSRESTQLTPAPQHLISQVPGPLPSNTIPAGQELLIFRDNQLINSVSEGSAPARNSHEEWWLIPTDELNLSFTATIKNQRCYCSTSVRTEAEGHILKLLANRDHLNRSDLTSVLQRELSKFGTEFLGIDPEKQRAKLSLSLQESGLRCTKFQGTPLTEIENSIGMQLVQLPAGEFIMGAKHPARQREAPQHRVVISKPFSMGIFPVTQKQFQKVMGANPSSFPGADRPIETVTWYDAKKFCERLSRLPEEQRQKRRYWLPSEAQWEYACRAGSEEDLPLHEKGLQLEECAWTKYNAKGKTHTVGQKLPNDWGLFDMHGNVYEWCFDRLDYNYYQKSPEVDPDGPNQGKRRIYRGGCWVRDIAYARSCYRGYAPPNAKSSWIGFRVICESG